MVADHFGRHPDAEIYLSQPGSVSILGARVLGEFGDDPHRYADAKARKNYAGTSPITRASGTKKVVLARYARNRRLGRRPAAMGLLLAARLTRRPRLLRRAPRPQDRPPGRATPARQPARRHPARLPRRPTPSTTRHTAWAHHHQPPLDIQKPGMSAAVRYIGTAECLPVGFPLRRDRRPGFGYQTRCRHTCAAEAHRRAWSTRRWQIARLPADRCPRVWSASVVVPAQISHSVEPRSGSRARRCSAGACDGSYARNTLLFDNSFVLFLPSLPSLYDREDGFPG